MLAGTLWLLSSNEGLFVDEWARRLEWVVRWARGRNVLKTQKVERESVVIDVVRDSRIQKGISQNPKMKQKPMGGIWY